MVNNKELEGKGKMKEQPPVFGITYARLATIVKVITIGILLTESYYLGHVAGERLKTLYEPSGYTAGITILGAITATLILTYTLIRTSPKKIKNILISGRIDLLLSLSTGLLISKSFNGIGTKYYENAILTLSIMEISALTLIPLAILLIIITRTAVLKIRKFNKYEASPIFLSDSEKQNREQDLLGFSDSAEKFAERVLNGGSTDSLVFGLDAPWGIGKSSFLNFCIEYWKYNQKEEIIIYKFNPLQFDGSSQLADKFIDGLIVAIQEAAFIPEIRPAISKYSRLLSGKSELSFSGIKLGISTAPSLDDTINDLKIELDALNKKIIIVIDDLDRIEFSSIKSILFAIKKSFSLPNISYVICYDSENISTLAEDYLSPEKTIEFLEKFINLKTSIYIENESLARFITKNLHRTITGNFQADPLLVSKAAEGLVALYKGENYHKYRPYIGDVRKLKRILNTIIILDIDQTDFDNIDINKKDLINLILIYINYPHIFRKIYETETYENSGFFSLVGCYDIRHPKYGKNDEKYLSNSQLFINYMNEIDEEPKFLINQVFDASIRLEDNSIEDITEEDWRSFACFNGCGMSHKNLGAYLNLIVKSSKRKKQKQYRFYAKIKDDLKKGIPLKNILSKKDFCDLESEENHKYLWRTIINSASEIPPNVAAELIAYLRDNITKYSIYENKFIGLGLREDLHYHLVKLLDSSGWSSKSSSHDNRYENIKEIADWVFGDNSHAENGILKSLMDFNRGILGLYDTLKFRLYCSADRGGEIYNLTRALSLRSDPNSPTSGLVREIAKSEMREISQEIFQLFKKTYIDEKINIFSLIEKLTLTDILGSWHRFFIKKEESGDVNIDDANIFLQKLKSRLRLFITYQLGNKNDKNGICCGFYDTYGSENNGEIAKIFNDYLFEICFSPNENNPDAHENFVQFLLSNLLGQPLYDDETPKPEISHFTKVLDPKRLARYWYEHREHIHNKNFNKSSKKIITNNFEATYSDFVDDIFARLDALVEEKNKDLISTS